MKKNKSQKEPTHPYKRALKELTEFDLKFALLRHPLSWEKMGDIDIIVDDADNFSRLLQKLGYIRLNRKDCYNFIKFDEASEQWIHLDVGYDIVNVGAVKSPHNFISSLLERSCFSDDGIPVLSKTDEAILLLFHLALDKGNFNPNYSERIFDIDKEMVFNYSEFYNFLPEPLENYWKWVEDFKNGLISDKTLIKKIRRSFPKKKRRSLLGRLYKRIKKTLLGPKVIAFLGPDGSGKTSLIEPITRLKRPLVRLQYMGPARELEMFFMFKVFLRLFSRMRKSYSKKNLIGIFARAGWQFICYLDFLERIWRHIWFLGSSGVVLCDRYACDMYFRKPRKWSEFLFIKLFPRPRFVFLCTGNAEIIHERKPELSPEKIKSTIDLYHKKLKQYNVPYIEINTTTSPINESIPRIVNHLQKNNWFR